MERVFLRQPTTTWAQVELLTECSERAAKQISSRKSRVPPPAGARIHQQRHFLDGQSPRERHFCRFFDTHSQRPTAIQLDRSSNRSSSRALLWKNRKKFKEERKGGAGKGQNRHQQKSVTQLCLSFQALTFFLRNRIQIGCSLVSAKSSFASF